jgi:sugar/nucleoside kinase (ribokinase family)
VRFGSDALANGAQLALEGRFAAILQNHGAVAYGRDLEEAYERARLLEWLASVYRLARSVGEPRILDSEELAEVAAEARRRRDAGLTNVRPPAERVLSAKAAGEPSSLGSVVSLGSHILDVLGRPVTAIPPGQGVAILQEIRATAAGTAAGTSVDLAKLGVAVSSIGAIGDDELGDLLVALLARHGVDTSLIVRKLGASTAASILPIRPNGERPALHAPGATGTLDMADLTEAHWRAIEGADVLHVGGPDALGRFGGAPLVDVMRRAKAHGAAITVDVLGSGGRLDLERLAAVIALADWFLPNEDQLLSLTGENDLHLAAARILGLGTGGLVVTSGASGCCIFEQGASEQLPALPVEVVDTTGCGDGFDAGFITGLLLGCPTLECAWLATACGALVASGLGSDAGIASLGQTVELLEVHRPAMAAEVRRRRHDREARAGSGSPASSDSAHANDR